MSLEVLNACVAGYKDRLFDRQILAVQAGYWAGYYSKARRPKNVKYIMNSMLRKRQQSEQKTKIAAPEVDVSTFLEMERRFKEKMSQ